jgi:hypothetical protein
MIPASASQSIASTEKVPSVPRLPKAKAAAKKMGTPIGIVIDNACDTDPVNIPRRAEALLSANIAAESRARKPPSIPKFSLAAAYIKRTGSLIGRGMALVLAN